ncbi:nascent polypeptide-associated complex subunit alpha, muscle-specific form-like [Melopsittacus undulatus]|uniref:nascent polypeptide-associated complex subunit alpha, muscle-specific form-like n=1 Tax=Melopsittacus undulatus TaxID=13146 RepID=UPI001469BEEA|nr:nascent polypeptide-associated complex subunit alpha, muscle-specific form-like [Melopsittacus undulatus]
MPLALHLSRRGVEQPPPRGAGGSSFPPQAWREGDGPSPASPPRGGPLNPPRRGRAATDPRRTPHPERGGGREGWPGTPMTNVPTRQPPFSTRCRQPNRSGENRLQKGVLGCVVRPKGGLAPDGENYASRRAARSGPEPRQSCHRLPLSAPEAAEGGLISLETAEVVYVEVIRKLKQLQVCKGAMLHWRP